MKNIFVLIGLKWVIIIGIGKALQRAAEEGLK